ncbi:MAG: hypothetical protein WCF85_16355 [Rhodospirillaceae bacterium]
MIRLNLPTMPYWLDLPEGVRVNVRPPDTAIDGAAMAYAVDAVRRRGELTPSEKVGAISAALATGLGLATIIDWAGVLPSEGRAGPGYARDHRATDGYPGHRQRVHHEILCRVRKG